MFSFLNADHSRYRGPEPPESTESVCTTYNGDPIFLIFAAHAVGIIDFRRFCSRVVDYSILLILRSFSSTNVTARG
jgi:hypothetical protein